nr:NADH dehydrogenase subunit 4 [Pherusa bengalensis]
MLKIILPTLLLLLLNQHYWIMTMLLLPLSLVILPYMIPLNNNLAIMSMNFHSDMLSSPLILLSLWVSATMMTVSYKIFYTKNNPKKFITMVILLMLTLTLAFSSSNMILFYIMFETSLIPTLLLILIWGYQPERTQAGMYMMIYTITASLPLLINIMFLHTSNPHMNMLTANWTPHTPLPLSIWWFTMMMAFMVKLPLYSVHLWLPKAHVEAPVAGSMILAGILLKLGGYGVLRLSTIFQHMTHSLALIFSPLAMWGAMLTSFICLRQADLKALIAYSSVAHMGIMIASTMMTNSWAWNSTLMMMLAHGICSPALFALANMTYEKTNTRSAILTKGMLLIAPTMTMWWFLFTAANMAAPPFMNLLSEIMLITGIIAHTYSLIMPLFILSFMGVAYSLHMYTLSQHGHLPSFYNPSSPFSSLNMMNNTLMFTPLLLLILKTDIISAWL